MFCIRVVSSTKQDDLATVVGHCKSSDEVIAYDDSQHLSLHPAGDPVMWSQKTSMSGYLEVSLRLS